MMRASIFLFQYRRYDDFNKAEGLTRQDGWNGSDNIGGSSRLYGTKLSVEELGSIADNRVRQELLNV